MFELPQLAYQYSVLEPYIDAKTMEIHHTKHHQAYIDKLNGALDKHPELKEKTLEWLMANLNEIPEEIRTVVRNNGGGHYNHMLYWEIMRPNAAKASGKLLEDINTQFGSIDKLKEEFTNAALNRFGSGWAWLSVNKDKKIIVHSTANQDTPLMDAMNPIMGVDVWEHAYYLNYQNRRADYLKAWIDNLADGEIIGKRYEKIIGQ